MDANQELNRKLQTYHQQTLQYIDDIREALSRVKRKTQVICYFTYALDLSHHSEHDNLCLATFHIQNLGNTVMKNPVICLKISEDAPFTFSGRYVTKKAKSSLKVSTGWEKLNEDTSGGEWWFKPLGKEAIHPEETLSFANFQLKWTAEESYKGNMHGFLYGDQYKEGLTALNAINLSGNVAEEGDYG